LQIASGPYLCSIPEFPNANPKAVTQVMVLSISCFCVKCLIVYLLIAHHTSFAVSQGCCTDSALHVEQKLNQEMRLQAIEIVSEVLCCIIFC